MLGQKLRELREAKGLVQRQIAAELEVDTAYISKVENEGKPMSKDHLKKLSKFYKIPINELELIWKADKILNLIQNDGYENISRILSMIDKEMIKNKK